MSLSKLEEDIDDFFLPIYVVMLMPRSSDLLDSSNFLFLKFTVSEIEFFTITLESVAPNFFAKLKQYDAFFSKNS